MPVLNLLFSVKQVLKGQDAMETPATKARIANRLIHETSPYLQQHAYNPVDWYPWGIEAFEKAAQEDKPIFLSIGYSSCHWCHVMERESFENEDIAARLNRDFVSIKVDREERPDLDDIYMASVVAMTGQGGWPMSVFLTPDRRPFYGGTYFPPTDVYGRPGFATVLQRIAEHWKRSRSQILGSAEDLTRFLNAQFSAPAAAGSVTPELLSGATAQLQRVYDTAHGGWDDMPKFPSSGAIALLLRAYRRTGDAALLGMAEETLRRMAQGGLYDQIGGGFHRYSVDAEWLVPHFEKMLYDNAQLSVAYLEAWQVTGNPLYRRVAAETLDYVLRDMRGPHGAFYSAEDADSEGEEGKFYLWTHAEVMDVLGPAAGWTFCAYYNVRPRGNFQSHEAFHAEKNIPHVTDASIDLARTPGLPHDELEAELAAFRTRLREVRARRVRPFLDDKVLVSWNGLMISALARGGVVLGEPRYVKAAETAARFIRNHMMRDGMLLRTHRNGESRLSGYLDDYAFLANAYLDLFEATGELHWYENAEELAARMIDRFRDAGDGCFRFTGAEHADVLVQTRPVFDNQEPSGNTMAALALLRLARFSDRNEHAAMARTILEQCAVSMQRAPQGFLKMLGVVDFMLGDPVEVVVAGPHGRADTEALLQAAWRVFQPSRVIVPYDPDSADATRFRACVPLAAGKGLAGGKATAYVCENHACGAPITDPEQLRTMLAR